MKFGKFEKKKLKSLIFFKKYLKFEKTSQNFQPSNEMNLSQVARCVDVEGEDQKGGIGGKKSKRRFFFSFRI